MLAFVSQTCFVCANTLMAHYSRWIEFLGGDLRQVGWIMGACALAGLGLRPWMAQWMNRLGARAMWGIGYALFAASSIANLWLDDLGAAIYLVRSGIVLGTAIVFASGLTYITQTTPEHRRTEAIGIFGIGGFLGMMTGPILGDVFLAERGRENFTLLFVVATIACVLPMIGISQLRPTSNGGRKASLRIKNFIEVTMRYWPGTILLVDLAFGVCMAAPFVFLASFIDGASLVIDGVSVIGLFFFCYAGMGITIRVWSRRLPERVGAKRVLLVGMVFMSAGMFCFALVNSSNPWMIVVPALMTGIGHSLMFHTMTSLTLAPFPSEVRGTGSALALMMLDLGTVGGAPVLGVIGERYGYEMLFAAIGMICLVAALGYGLTARRS